MLGAWRPPWPGPGTLSWDLGRWPSCLCWVGWRPDLGLGPQDLEVRCAQGLSLVLSRGSPTLCSLASRRVCGLEGSGQRPEMCLLLLSPLPALSPHWGLLPLPPDPLQGHRGRTCGAGGPGRSFLWAGVQCQSAHVWASVCDVCGACEPGCVCVCVPHAPHTQCPPPLASKDRSRWGQLCCGLAPCVLVPVDGPDAQVTRGKCRGQAEPGVRAGR